MKNSLLILGIVATFYGCKNKAVPVAASGTFEAVETLVSSEATGTIKWMGLEEGAEVKEGQLLVVVDTTQLYLKKLQVRSQITALLSRKPDVPVQIAALREQVNHLEKEQKRVENLYRADATTQKQLDDIISLTNATRNQLKALESNLEINSSSLSKESEPLNVQLRQLDDQLSRCRIRAPFDGTILNRYAELGELLVAGKPVFKLADLRTLILRVYVTGDQLPSLKLGDKIKVFTDSTSGGQQEQEGEIDWISPRAEFTPKTIQTKDERANLVYAVKIRVSNPGNLKIGMYGELKF